MANTTTPASVASRLTDERSNEKMYTAQEMREAADCFDCSNKPYWFSRDEWDEMVAMLRQAADTEEELAKVRARMEAVLKDCVQYERIGESLRAANGIIESERTDKLKVIKELNDVRELNRKCCDENEQLRARLEAVVKIVENNKWPKRGNVQADEDA